MDNAIARPGENFVFAVKDTRDTPELSEMGSDSSFRQVCGDALEANGGDGATGRPAVDQGAVACCGYLYIIIHTENSYMYLS